MKRIVSFLLLLILFSTLLSSIQQEIELPEGEIELRFDNVKLNDLSFIEGEKVRIISDNEDIVTANIDYQILKISSIKPIKIDLELPQDRTYTYEKTDLFCRFSVSMITLIDKRDETTITIKDKILIVQEKDGTKIAEIGPEGIYAYDDNEIVRIGKDGIIIEGDGKDTQFTGFWGKMLGGFIRLVTSGVMSVIDSSPDKIITDVVNDEKGRIINSLLESSADTRIKRSLSKTFEGKDGVVSNLEINNSNGDVEISAWSETYVRIDVDIFTNKEEKELKKVDISVEGEEDCIIKTLNRPRSVSIDYKIKIPKTTAVKTVTTTNGRIILQDIEGDNLVAQSSNGNIVTSNVYNIKSLKTTNSRIRAEILNITDDIEILSSNGAILLQINPNLEANFLMRTSNGTIDTNITNFHERERSKFTLQGDMGDGIHTIRVNTSNANITIDELK